MIAWLILILGEFKINPAGVNIDFSGDSIDKKIQKLDQDLMKLKNQMKTLIGYCAISSVVVHIERRNKVTNRKRLAQHI